MRRTLWMALISALTLTLATGCLSETSGGGGDDPEPSMDPNPGMNPDPNPGPGPGMNPDPNPGPQPGVDPNPDPNPGPAPDNLDDALSAAADACEEGCNNYAGDVCLGEDLPLDECLVFCDYPTLFTDSFNHLEGDAALDCANAFLGLEECLSGLDCDGAIEFFTNADPEEDFPCKAEDAELQVLCPEAPPAMLDQDLIDALDVAADTCRTSCEAYAGDACPDGDITLEECQEFCNYDEFFPESFPNITNDQRGLDCIGAFTALETCLGGIACEDVTAYFDGDPEGAEDYPCKAEDLGIPAACDEFE